MAAAAVEAFVNEVIHMAQDPLEADPDLPKSRPKIAAIEDRESLETKASLLREALCGSAYDKGTQPYQDFSLLVSVRNAIVHRRAEQYAVDPAGEALDPRPLLRKLASKRILASTEGEFFFSIETRATAEWACDAAAAIMNDLASSAPTLFQTTLRARYPAMLSPAA